MKPRVSIARVRRSRNGLSSSTINNERSAWSVSSAIAFTIRVPPDDRRITYGAAAKGRQGRKRAIRLFSQRLRTILEPRILTGFLHANRFHPAHNALGSVFRGGFEAGARPDDMDHGAMIRENPVGEGDAGAGALQQRAGDEHTKTETTALALDLVGAAPP